MLRWIMLSVVVVAVSAFGAFMVQYSSTTEETPTTPAPTVFPVAPTSGPHPTAVIEEGGKYDFGKMAFGQEKDHVFTIKNTGEAEMQLKLMTKVCTCTNVLIDDVDLAKQLTTVVKVAPGEKKAVKLVWKPKDAKRFSTSANLGTNDPEHPSIPLLVTGDVYLPLVITPAPLLNFLVISNDIDHSGLVAVHPAEFKGLKITKLTSSKPESITAKAIPLEKSELDQLKTSEGFKIEVKVKDNMSLGDFKEEVVCETNCPDQKTFRIALMGTVVGPVNVIPTKLRMRNVTTTRGGRTAMTISVRGGRETKVDVLSAPDDLKITIEPTETKGQYQMVIVAPPGLSGGAHAGTILLRTDHPKAPEIKVPVDILVLNSDG